MTKKVVSVFASIVSSLSIFSFTADVFNLGLSDPMKILIAKYEMIAIKFFYPIKILFEYIVNLISVNFHLNFTLYDHWVHLLVPISLFISSDIATDFSRVKERKVFIRSALYAVFYGYLIACIGSFFSGLLPLDEQTLKNAVLVMLTFVIYQVVRCIVSGMLLNKVEKGETRIQAIMDYLYRFAFYDALMLIISVVIWLVIAVRFVDLPPLGVIILYMFLMTVPRFVLPAIYAYKNFAWKVQGISSGFRQYLNLGTVKVGWRILLTLMFFLFWLFGNYSTS